MAALFLSAVLKGVSANAVLDLKFKAIRKRRTKPNGWHLWLKKISRDEAVHTR